MTNENINIKTVLIVCPLSTVLNWNAEFDKWLKDVGSGEDVDVYHLAKYVIYLSALFYIVYLLFNFFCSVSH